VSSFYIIDLQQFSALCVNKLASWNEIFWSLTAATLFVNEFSNHNRCSVCSNQRRIQNNNKNDKKIYNVHFIMHTCLEKKNPLDMWMILEPELQTWNQFICLFSYCCVICRRGE
jgi:hypothetical protein